jgi:hypothetical protein
MGRYEQLDLAHLRNSFLFNTPCLKPMKAFIRRNDLPVMYDILQENRQKSKPVEVPRMKSAAHKIRRAANPSGKATFSKAGGEDFPWAARHQLPWDVCPSPSCLPRPPPY